jgi:hypothetical protein
MVFSYYYYAKDKKIESLLEKFSLIFIEKKALWLRNLTTNNNIEIKE